MQTETSIKKSEFVSVIKDLEDPSKLSKEKTPNQSTLLHFKASASAETAEGKGIEGQMSEVLASLRELKLEVSGMKQHHQNICNIAFTDDRALVDVIKNSSNLEELNDACDLLEWFYDETSKIGILSLIVKPF